MLISYNTQVGKKLDLDSNLIEKNLDSNMIQKGNVTLLRCFPKYYFAADIDRSKCLHATSSKVPICMHYVGNMIYCKFSHGDVFYRLNGKLVNIMLELAI